MLVNQRIDVLVEDKFVVNRLAAQGVIDMAGVHNSGCMAPLPFYLALHPELDSANSLIEQLNQKLADPDNQQRLRMLEPVLLKACQRPTSSKALNTSLN